MSGQDAALIFSAAERGNGAYVAVAIAARAISVTSFDLLADYRAKGLPARAGQDGIELSALALVAHYLVPSGKFRNGASMSGIHADGCGVYFLRCGRFVKIGMAANLRSRLDVCALHNPFELEVILFIPTLGTAAARQFERQLHRRFSEFHHRGEWFRDCPEIGGFCSEELHR